MLFAELETWVQVVGAIVLFVTSGGLVGGAIKFFDWWSKRKERQNQLRSKEEREIYERKRRERVEDDARENAARDRLLVRLEADIKESRQEIHDIRDKAQRQIDELRAQALKESSELRNQIIKLRVREARMLVHVRYLEDLMREREITFTPLADLDDPDSGEVELHGPPEPSK